jgi:hypothetical protein
VVEPGLFRAFVGGSSEADLATTFRLTVGLRLPAGTQ